MTNSAKKTVAAISFHNDKNLSIDIENVVGVSVGIPQQIDDRNWFLDLIIRSDTGNVSLQLTSDDIEKLKAIQQDQPD